MEELYVGPIRKDRAANWLEQRISILTSQSCRDIKYILVKNLEPQVTEAPDVPSVLWE